MSGSEFPSKALLAEHEPESEYPHDSDEYSERDFCISEHYAVNEKHGPPQQRPRKSRPIFVYFLALAGGLLACRYLASAGFFNTGMSCPGMQSPRKPPPMEVFQVYPPVRVGEEYLPEDMAHERHECSVVLMQHVFGWSYGKPFVGNYTPPPCEWTHVLFNLTMTSKGRQFDRLGLMFLGDVEVFRTSTAEPTWYGIEFGYVKDMTAYSSLLRTDQKIIFDLGNLVDDKYTGSFNATLIATFYTPPPSSALLSSPASIILPLSSHNSHANLPSHFHLPQDTAKTPITLPPNTIRALVSISASGNANEEFWYTNVPTAFTSTFGPDNTLPGHSPFREIQLLINNDLAGVAWPFATIFTGGINPGLWRPIVGIAAFDLPDYEIDITPLLPLLLTNETTFELRVVSWDPDPTHATIDNDWLVSARVLIWTDPDDTWITTGTVHIRASDEPKFTLKTVLETDNKGTRNVSLHCELTAGRALSTTSTIVTSTGDRLVSWTQGLSYTHRNTISANGTNQTVEMLTNGVNAATGTGVTGGTEMFIYRWPLRVVSSFSVDGENGNFTIYADVDRVVEENRGGGVMETRLNGSAVFVSGGYAKGCTEQSMGFMGVPKNGEGVGGYGRWVKAEEGRVVGDWEMVNGRGVGKVWEGEGEVEEERVEGMVYVGGGRTVRGILGRGPG